MPTTRAQAKRKPHRPPHPRPTDTTTSTPDLTEEEDTDHSQITDFDFGSDIYEEGSSSVRAVSGIAYDLAHLDPESEARALVGLTGRFAVSSCRETRRGYEFDLTERRQIEIASKTHTCNCVASKRRPGLACEHIFWLVNQIQGCFLTKAPLFDIPLLGDGQSTELPLVERLLADVQLDVVAQRLNWTYIGGRIHSCGEMQMEGQHATGMTRPQKVRDIISAFSTMTLPEDFRPDLVVEAEEQHHRTPEQCVVQGDFEATMFRLAVHDDGVFASLCKAMPAGACAAIYFDKIQERSRKMLADFDRYCLTGQTPSSSSEVVTIEVEQIIDTLQRNVYRIMNNVRLRSPHGTEGAAKALVTLLEDVCNRNKDALEGNRWGRITFHGEDEDQRNIYHQLIGKAAEEESAASGPGAATATATATGTHGFFVLDALEQLPASDLHRFRDKLWAILQKLEVNRAPKGYILKLHALARAAAAASSSSAAGSAGQKRPAGGPPEGTLKRSR